MYTFLGLDKEQWEIANALATCVGAVATSAAVAISLWLAGRPDKIELKVSAKHLLLITVGEKLHGSYAVIQVTNIGRRAARITNLGWEIGRGKKTQHFVQTIGRDSVSSPLPTIVEDGGEAQWFFPIEDWVEGWPAMLGRNWKCSIGTMTLTVHTSASRPIKARVDQELRKLIIERCQSKYAQ
jgi:hypothetical protein